MDENIWTMNRKAAHNIGLAIWRITCFYETFVQGSTTVILLSFCAKNPPHRQAENRCASAFTNRNRRQTLKKTRNMNFEILKQKIENATKKAFIEMFEKYGADEIYGFALYSDEGAMTVCPSTNTVKHLTTVDQDDLTYHKFEPVEWKYEGIGADREIEEICKQLRDELEKNEFLENDEYNEEWFLKFQSELYETCISVLEKLKKENFFKEIVGKDIFLTFTVSDYEFETKDLKNIIERLNDNEYKTEYLTWMKTWGQ